MSLNSTPSSERIHIGFFGRRNAGKSSLVNAVTGQDLAVVSDVPGTTTDPVKKAMELLPLGPVVIIDTPGLDDEGMLGELRIKKAEEILKGVHLAVVVVDGTVGIQTEDEALILQLEERKLPYIIAMNKADLQEKYENEKNSQKVSRSGQDKNASRIMQYAIEEKKISVSTFTGYNINLLKEKLALLGKGQQTDKRIVADLIEPGDAVVLVVPIDEAAPKGRLILPQQQTIRDILDVGAISVVCKDTELDDTLKKLGVKPKLVITDSQVFGKVSASVPDDILLTSFSILFARYKGNLDVLVSGAKALNKLQNGDKILMAEGCTHHRQCGDIGSVKIPTLIRKTTGKELIFDLTSGGDFPENLKDYALIIHCGGCTLTEQVMQERLRICGEAGVPVTNYGMALAHMNGILERSMKPFEDMEEIKLKR